MEKNPVYLLVDTSGSMSGEPIEAVNNGLKMLINTLRNDPMSLEIAWLSLITFDSQAKVIFPLTRVTEIQLPQLSAGGSTEMGAAIRLLQDQINKEISPRVSSETKGDRKPLVFMLTDGEPTDDWQSAVNQLNYKKLSGFITCGAGDANRSVLETISGKKEHVIMLSEANSASIAEFFKWVSQSIPAAAGSIPADGIVDLGQLPPPPGDDLL